MKKFLGGVKEVGNELEALQKVVADMNQTVRKVSGAANEKETQTLRKTLSGLREDFLDGMNVTKKGIENLKIKSQKGKTEYDKHIKEKHVRSLIERTKKLVEEFSTAQAEFGAEERHRLKSQYIIARPTATQEELEKVEYTDSPDPFALSKNTTQDSAERKESLKQISSDIQQVTQMTEDLNLLVHKSDRNVDKIAVTSTASEVKAKKADKDLKSALKYQKLARFAKLLALGLLGLLLLGFVFAIIGGLIFMVIVLARNISPQITGNATQGDTEGGGSGGAASGGTDTPTGNTTNTPTGNTTDTSAVPPSGNTTAADGLLTSPIETIINDLPFPSAALSRRRKETLRPPSSTRTHRRPPSHTSSHSPPSNPSRNKTHTKNTS